MSNGRGAVTIDASFGDSIDAHSDYHVFLPRRVTATGSTVRESRGGRSSLAFGYRIVAKPHDENGSRLALAAPMPHEAGLPRGRRTGATPLSAGQRFAQKIGPQGFARAMAGLRKRVNER